MTKTTNSEGRNFFNAMFWTVDEFWSHDVLDKLQAVSGKETGQWIRDLECEDRASLLILAKRVEEETDIHQCAEFLPESVSGASFAIAIKAVVGASKFIPKALPSDIFVCAKRFEMEFDKEVDALIAELSAIEGATSVRN